MSDPQNHAAEAELTREQRFSPEPHSAPAARQFVLAMGWSSDADVNLRLSTVVSEVVTNAILHARTPFVVTVTPGQRTIRVAVTDGSRDLPTKKTYGTLQPTGRGLHIIEEISDRWGVSASTSGKTVWFELERDQVAS